LCTICTMTNAAQPLNEMNQVIRLDAAPLDLFSLEKTEVATEMPTIVLECVKTTSNGRIEICCPPDGTAKVAVRS
jgi:hypothetical protein